MVLDVFVLKPKRFSVTGELKRIAITHAAGSELLEDSVKTAVQDGRVTDSDCRGAPDELDRVGQRVHAVVVNTIHCTHVSHSIENNFIHHDMTVTRKEKLD